MRKQTFAVLRDQLSWVRQLPVATETLFAARTPWGRHVKTLLFGIGVILPFGSLIWALLFMHGARIRNHALSRT